MIMQPDDSECNIDMVIVQTKQSGETAFAAQKSCSQCIGLTPGRKSVFRYMNRQLARLYRKTTHLPFLPILMSSHVCCLCINQIATKDDGIWLEEWQSIICKQTAMANCRMCSLYGKDGHDKVGCAYCKSPSLSPKLCK